MRLPPLKDREFWVDVFVILVRALVKIIGLCTGH